MLSIRKIVFFIAFTFLLQSCSGMSKVQQVTVGGATGAAIGATVGGAIGGKEGALIGGSVGLLLGGIAAYEFASDKFTQSTQQNASSWGEETRTKPEFKVVNDVIEDGARKVQVDEVDITLADYILEERNIMLNSGIRTRLLKTVYDAKVAGGSVTVICPIHASKGVMKELADTGANVMKDEELDSKYIIRLTRNKNEKPSLQPIPLQPIGKPNATHGHLDKFSSMQFI